MSVEYDYTKPGVVKTFVIDAQLHTLFPNNYSYFIYGDPNLQLFFNEALTDDEKTQLDNYVANYVDPAQYFVLSRTVPAPGVFYSITESTPTVAATFFNTATTSPTQNVLNSIKVICDYAIADITQAPNLPASANITFTLFDVTRNWSLFTNVFDISSTLQQFQSMYASDNTLTGTKHIYSTLQFDSLSQYTTNYDTIQQFMVSISTPEVSMTLNSIQMLYYQIF